MIGEQELQVDVLDIFCSHVVREESMDLGV